MHGRVLALLRDLDDGVLLAALGLEELEERHLGVRGERLEADVRVHERLEDRVEEAADADLEEAVAHVQRADHAFDDVG